MLAIPFQHTFSRVLCLSLNSSENPNYDRRIEQQQKNTQRIHSALTHNSLGWLNSLQRTLRHFTVSAALIYLIRCRYGIRLRIYIDCIYAEPTEWQIYSTGRHIDIQAAINIHTTYNTLTQTLSLIKRIYIYVYISSPAHILYVCFVHAKCSVCHQIYTNRLLQKSSVRFFHIILCCVLFYLLFFFVNLVFLLPFILLPFAYLSFSYIRHCLSLSSLSFGFGCRYFVVLLLFFFFGSFDIFYGPLYTYLFACSNVSSLSPPFVLDRQCIHAHRVKDKHEHSQFYIIILVCLYFYLPPMTSKYILYISIYMYG